MKHQKLQFNSAFLRLNELFRVVFLMCCLLSVGLTQAQEKKITAEFKDEPLSNVLKRLEKLSTYKILFTYDDVQSYKVTVSLKDLTIPRLYRKYLRENHLFFRMLLTGSIFQSCINPRKNPIQQGRSRGKSWIIKVKRSSVPQFG